MTTDAARLLFARAGQPLPAALCPAAPSPLPAGPSAWEVREEKRIQEAIEGWIRLQGWKYIRAPMHKKSALPVGHPDFTVFIPGGRCVFLEVKTLVGKLSADQVEMLTALDGAGFATCVPRSDIQGIEWLRVQAEISLTAVLQPAQSVPAGS